MNPPAVKSEEEQFQELHMEELKLLHGWAASESIFCSQYNERKSNPSLTNRKALYL